MRYPLGHRVAAREPCDTRRGGSRQAISCLAHRGESKEVAITSEAVRYVELSLVGGSCSPLLLAYRSHEACVR